jgi:hypothetical protein
MSFRSATIWREIYRSSLSFENQRDSLAVGNFRALFFQILQLFLRELYRLIVADRDRFQVLFQQRF